MFNINEIFNGGQQEEKPKSIQTVIIDWKQHSRGIINIAKNIVPNFVVNSVNKNALRLMLLYFTGNSMFEEELEYGSLDKGILLVGDVGTGKSLLFEIFHYYTREILMVNSFRKFTAIDIIDNVNVSGASYLEQFSNNMIGSKAMPQRCYFDDICSKNETVKHFGTQLNVIEQLLSLRYNIFTRYGILTHATSNKYPSEMEAIYDKRIADRLVEMFNIIELTGKSFRK